jgi:hypothetical protein
MVAFARLPAKSRLVDQDLALEVVPGVERSLDYLRESAIVLLDDLLVGEGGRRWSEYVHLRFTIFLEASR